VAHASGETLLAILNDTLDLSRIEAGKVKLERVPFRLSEQMQICLAIMEVRAKEKNIRLELKMEDQLHDCFRGDPTRIRQILMNLLSNAIKFSERGTVTVAARMGQDVAASVKGVSLVLSVHDEGIGVAENQKQIIFERFKQADQTVTRRFGGAGLGLTIIKRLAEMMDGRVWVDSIVGRGSTFFVEVVLKPEFALPLNIAGTLLEVPDHSLLFPLRLQENRQKENIRMLLADDCAENRFVLSAFLSKFPVTISFAENGQQAFDLFKEKEFDIVFMDVQMPILDGYSSTRQIRLWEEGNRRSFCPIIACTANALEEDLRMSRAAGCDDHLSKPVSKQKLLAMINKHLVEPRSEFAEFGDSSHKIIKFSPQSINQSMPGLSI
jgi:CheY-like chemotaxis protein/anti-sigma regulatory factor (Ser/Thr protein kinase)